MMSEITAKDEPVLCNPEIICERCQLSFSRKSTLYCHMRKIHHEYDLNISKSNVCGICKEKLRTMPLLHAHIAEKHDVSLQFAEETFYCEEDFLKWKLEIESGSQSNFVMKNAKNCAREGMKLRFYVCHRSGFPAAKERNSTRKGYPSIKIGSTCPACMNVVSETVDGISCIKVKYQSVHVGHELGFKLRLPKEDKARLASSLKAGISVPNLLKQLRENYAPSHPYRRLTRKDLYNIGQRLNLSKTRLVRQDDFVSVDVVVKKIFSSDFQTALLVYKPVGETLPEYPTINENDFLLGIMNDVQEKLMEFYGNTCIMIDYTGCENFYLSTIMVRDLNSEILPVATFFSSKISIEMLQPLFDAIQRRLPQLKTKIMMTDDVNPFYDAWQKVFKDESQHLLCSWSVRRNLFRNVEIKVNNKNRKVIKNRLGNLMREEDVTAFEFKIEAFINDFENEENDFITFFMTHYEPKSQKWAYCYRIALGLSPDVRLERWRNQLKLDEKGTVAKRLDKTLSLVCSTVANRLISNTIAMDMEKLSSRILLCQKLHEESMSMGDECGLVEESEKKCIISEIEDGKSFSYIIEKVMGVCGCDIKCETCNICLHSMTCTCVDYCVHFVICKHLHRFCKSFSTASKSVVSQESDDSFGFCDNEPLQPLGMGHTSTEPIRHPQFIIDDVRTRVITQLQALEKRMGDITYLETLKNVEEQVNSINSYLDSTVSPCCFSNKVPKT